jgi:hypothetical protein
MNKHYEVTLTETIKTTTRIIATSEDRAIDLVRSGYKLNQEIEVLESDWDAEEIEGE